MTRVSNGEPVSPSDFTSISMSIPPASAELAALAVELRQVLGHLVGLGQHRHARLHQDLTAGEGRHLGRDIEVEKGAPRRFLVLDGRGEVGRSELEAVLAGTDVGAGGVQLVYRV